MEYQPENIEPSMRSKPDSEQESTKSSKPSNENESRKPSTAAELSLLIRMDVDKEQYGKFLDDVAGELAGAIAKLKLKHAGLDAKFAAIFHAQVIDF